MNRRDSFHCCCSGMFFSQKKGEWAGEMNSLCTAIAVRCGLVKTENVSRESRFAVIVVKCA